MYLKSTCPRFNIPFRYKPKSTAEKSAFDDARGQTGDLTVASQTALIVAVKEDVDRIAADRAMIGKGSLIQNGVDYRDFDDFVEVFNAALFSQDVYFDRSIPELMPGDYRRLGRSGLKQVGLTPEALRDDSSGYFGAVYRSLKAGRYVYANRGTNMTSPEDWINNGLQGFGELSPQYMRAIKNAIAMRDALKGTSRITFVGHSLGGGLAQAQAIVTGAQAIVFNSSYVHPDTVPGYDIRSANGLVRNFTVDGDVLTYGQMHKTEITAIAAPLAGAGTAAVTGNGVTGMKVAATLAYSGFTSPAFYGEHWILPPVDIPNTTGGGLTWRGTMSAPNNLLTQTGEMVDLHGMYRVISSLGYRNMLYMHKMDATAKAPRPWQDVPR